MYVLTACIVHPHPETFTSLPLHRQRPQVNNKVVDAIVLLLLLLLLLLL